MVALNVGDVLAIKCWWGEHWGIVGSQHGRLTFISNSYRRGQVAEEWLDEAIGTSEWRVVPLATQLPAYLVIARARSQVGRAYDFWVWNCEDLVYWARGLKQQSPQRNAVVGLVSLIGVVLVVGGIARKA